MGKQNVLQDTPEQDAAANPDDRDMVRFPGAGAGPVGPGAEGAESYYELPRSSAVVQNRLRDAFARGIEAGDFPWLEEERWMAQETGRGSEPSQPMQQYPGAGEAVPMPGPPSGISSGEPAPMPGPPAALQRRPGPNGTYDPNLPPGTYDPNLPPGTVILTDPPIYGPPLDSGEPARRAVPVPPERNPALNPYTPAAREHLLNSIMSQMGGNPYDRDIDALTESELARELPNLLLSMSHGAISWEDRGRLTKEQQKQFITAARRLRADIRNRLKQKQSMDIKKLHYMEQLFDTERRMHEAKLRKEAREAAIIRKDIEKYTREQQKRSQEALKELQQQLRDAKERLRSRKSDLKGALGIIKQVADRYAHLTPAEEAERSILQAKIKQLQKDIVAWDPNDPSGLRTGVSTTRRNQAHIRLRELLKKLNQYDPELRRQAVMDRAGADPMLQELLGLYGVGDINGVGSQQKEGITAKSTQGAATSAATASAASNRAEQPEPETPVLPAAGNKAPAQGGPTAPESKPIVSESKPAKRRESIKLPKQRAKIFTDRIIRMLDVHTTGRIPSAPTITTAKRLAKPLLKQLRAQGYTDLVRRLEKALATAERLHKQDVVSRTNYGALTGTRKPYTPKRSSLFSPPGRTPLDVGLENLRIPGG